MENEMENDLKDIIDGTRSMSEEDILALLAAVRERQEALVQEKRKQAYRLASQVKEMCKELKMPLHVVFPEIRIPEPHERRIRYQNADGDGWNGKGRRPEWLKAALRGLSGEEQIAVLEKFRV